MTRTLVADIDPDFEPDPITGDVGVLSFENAAKQSLLDLLRTRVGERPWASNIGTPELLYSVSNANNWKITQVIEQTAFQYSQDIQIRDVRVEYMTNTNRINVFISYSISGQSQDIKEIEVRL